MPPTRQPTPMTSSFMTCCTICGIRGICGNVRRAACGVRQSAANFFGQGSDLLIVMSGYDP